MIAVLFFALLFASVCVCQMQSKGNEPRASRDQVGEVATSGVYVAVLIVLVMLFSLIFMFCFRENLNRNSHRFENGDALEIHPITVV